MQEKTNRFYGLRPFLPEWLQDSVLKRVPGDMTMQWNPLKTGRRRSGFFRLPLAVWMSFSALVPVALLPAVAWAADASTFSQHVESARGYMNANQWTYANYEWRAALAEDPANVEANIGLAETLLQAGLIPDAVTHLGVVREQVHKLSLELEYAKVLEAAQQYSDAKDIYILNLKRVPLELESFTKLRALLSKLPEAEQKAVQDYLQDVATDAANNAHAALSRKNYAEAARNFAISTQISRNLTDGNDYGLTLLLQQRYNEALKAFDDVKRIGYDTWQLYANSAFVVLGQGNPFGAVRNMEKAIGLCSDASKKPQLYNDLGFLYENQNKWQKARSAYSRAVDLDSAYTKAKMNLAYAYQKDMAYEDSIKTYQSILLREPNNTKVLNQMGFVYELANKPKQALLVYKKAMEVSPQNQEGYYNLAILYKKLGKTREADQAYKQMMDMEFNRMEMAQKKEAPASPVTTTASGNPASATASNLAMPMDLANGDTSKSAEPQQMASKANKEVRDGQKGLLEYVDVFFSPVATTTSSNN